MKRYLWLIIPLLFIPFLPNILSFSLSKPFLEKKISDKTHARVLLGSYRFSWFGPQVFHDVKWHKKELSGEITELAIHAPIWSFKGPFSLEQATLFYEGKKVETLSGEVHGTALKLTGEHLTLQGTFESRDSYDLALSMDNFPIHHPYFGDTLSANGRISNKLVDLDVSSPNLKTHIVGLLHGHSFTLTQPLDATFFLKTGPLISQTAGHLHLEPTEIPLPFSLSRFKAAGTLDLSKAVYTKGASLASVLSLLGAHPSDQPNIWFAPFDFTLKDGLLTMGRLDFLLANSIHLCVWGEADLISKELRLILGLPADTLARSFGITNLNQDYVMKVEVKGTMDHPDINKKPVATKIAALAAANQIPGKSLFGNVVSIISRPPSDKDVPPAKHPFPWEK